MSRVVPQFVYGYHGCDRTVGGSVLAGKTSLRSSLNSYDWLGAGIYFWENAPGRAFDWARSCMEHPRMTRGKIQEPFVVGAIIDVGVCLYLTDVSQMKVLKTAYLHLQDTFALNNMQLPHNSEKNRALDCLVINTAVELNHQSGYPAFDTVRGAYIEGEPIYPEAMLYDKTHIQICVRNPECIVGYFLPAENQY